MTRSAGVDRGGANTPGPHPGRPAPAPRALAPEPGAKVAAPDAVDPVPAPPGRRRKRTRVGGAPAGAGTPELRVPSESGVHLLAAELHDGLSQQLFAAELDVHELRCTPGLTPEVREVLDRLAKRLEMGSKELRGALFKMLEAEREQEELVSVSERVRDAVTDFRSRHGFTATVRMEGVGPEPEAAAARLLLRTVREGLANVVKHAHATEVLVVLSRGRRWWTVEVHDDGAGDPASIGGGAAEARSFGLFSLVSESSRVGGRLWVIRSAALAGVQLNVSVPVGTPRA